MDMDICSLSILSIIKEHLMILLYDCCTAGDKGKCYILKGRFLNASLLVLYGFICLLLNW